MHKFKFHMKTPIGILCYIVNYILGFFKRYRFRKGGIYLQLTKKLCFFRSQCSVSPHLGATATRYGRKEGPLILTPLIEHGEAKKAKKQSEVDPSLFAGVNSHAAYFTVDKIRKWNLFFWYFPAQDVDLESTPLVIWLQGGPGDSSLYGLFGEIGPLQIIDGSVTKMPLSWGSSYSLLFIDNPVGAGFSFTEGGEYATNEDEVGQCLLTFMKQFLQVFPELRNAPLFIAGESYAGKYIPAFGHYIHHDQDYSNRINLRGLAIGNGIIDPPTMLRYSEWALQVGLIDHKQAKDMSRLESEARRNWRERNLFAYKQNASKVTRMMFDITPIENFNYVNGEANKITWPLTDLIETFLNKPEVQNSLHVKNNSFSDKNVSGWLNSDVFLTVKPWLEELMEHYGVLCYNGQLDMVVPYAISVHTYRSLQWTGRKGYLEANREWLFDEENDSKINSVVKMSGNFMEAMVVGAGHMVPADKPRAAKQLIDMFINRYR